ncbi:hypothetical protein EMIT048CA2_60030 [Pseudomonas chlororaphis]
MNPYFNQKRWEPQARALRDINQRTIQ